MSIFLTVLTGFVLFITAIQISYDQRRKESAVSFSGIAAHVITDRLFQQTYYPDIECWLWGILSGATGIALLGHIYPKRLRFRLYCRPILSIASLKFLAIGRLLRVISPCYE